MLIHGTCVDLDGAGVLFRGPSGSGKSDLALRLIDGYDARLVADDQVELTCRGDDLIASPPSALAGMLEVRGFGLVRQPHLESAAVVMVIDLCPRDAIKRLPNTQNTTIEGKALPCLCLCPQDASACAKVRLALDHVRNGKQLLDTAHG
ncbi:MAG: HPr kinase/phosphatase C-terminal domain-containing protein [Alphaproteobacteria bacterium]|jgi:HPr kinase/phosphorylase|nr:serine/threonine protein kinase [Rhodospirillaceae bacterium]MDG2481741.1 HPr kinase/phosphatase C-terminal domain-containing protein [Alphaproteobacteria bacterium]MBT6206056.1 serine/threonine protein kinase [Rhodospirillaceae bacterium]MBT6511544.1 serine/threonine protein kinase [Rhodospirillaceae bacterium]MBT7614212.1 serine/threonine protein kinase [Rhodospirillaceae bacterium]